MKCKVYIIIMYLLTFLLSIILFFIIAVPHSINSKKAEEYAIEFIKEEQDNKSMEITTSNVIKAMSPNGRNQKGWHVYFKTVSGQEYYLYVDLYTNYVLYER